jgi:nucleoside-diphosphate-sugar epimerase
LSFWSQAKPVFCSGATGYIGGAILRRLVAEDVPALGGVRSATALVPGVTLAVTGDLSKADVKLPPVGAVIHAAGLGHKRGVSPETWARENVDAAVGLARAAREAGAEKFILISTAHIHGRVRTGMVTDSTPPNPMDLYAESKLQAEYDVAAAFGPGLSIIRPVAVIGPECPGNIPLLLKLLARKVPLPVGAIANRRSFIDRDDLAGIVLAVLRSEKPPQSVLAAHPETISTPDLVRALAEGLGVRAKIWSWPPELLAAGAMLLGRQAMWQSLSGDFVPNPVAALGLGWRPAETLAESFVHLARYYHTTGAKA